MRRWLPAALAHDGLMVTILISVSSMALLAGSAIDFAGQDDESMYPFPSRLGCPLR